ncbi:hypothetical protein [Deinococcus sp. YIM 77859]|uniref:hypothetical protein n=1 Tax=Deinococcus sp. YIM 77859 TaxID=1540221 RepID=UPI000A601E48|nr:hypothetical protein [Deinococcus sp. YIM 77859]
MLEGVHFELQEKLREVRVGDVRQDAADGVGAAVIEGLCDAVGAKPQLVYGVLDPRTFLLGCGAPLASSIGLVDAMRTGPDVAPFWDEESRRIWLGDGTGPSARNALHTALSRWYQHTWYQPDPDVMIARRELSLLNNDERGALLGLLDVIGGLRASSDPLQLLDAPALELLRRSLELSRPDRPRTLTRSFGPAVTHFTRGTFNLLDVPTGGLAPHSYSSAPLPAGGREALRCRSGPEGVASALEETDPFA